MPPTKDRPFSVRELIVLVAAASVGFSFLRALNDSPAWAFRGITEAPGTRRGIAIASVVLSPMTLAVLLLAYYREKPPRHRLGRRPGYVATASATMGILLYVVFALTHRALMPPVGISGANYLSMVLGAFPTYGGMAVAGAWVALALGRRWRPEASSIDRLGRFLGASWILLIVVNWAQHLARW